MSNDRYGDPQKRNRVFVQAVKIDLIRMTFPRETHDKCVTCKDILKDLASVEPQEGNGAVELIRQDGTLSFIENHCRDGTAPLKADRTKLKADQPAHTIRRKDNVEHYNFERMTTVREQGRLQSFPDTFKFRGTRQQQLDGIGNAVPVKTAKVLGLTVLQMYKNCT